MKLIDSVHIRLDDTDYFVIGADFRDIVAAIKSLPERRFDPDTMIWSIAGSLDSVQAQISRANSDLRILDENGLLDAEFGKIKTYQKWLLDDEADVRAKIAETKAAGDRYSFKPNGRDMGRNQARLLREYGCLHHALDHAKRPAESLTEPEIASLRKACQIMGWE